MTLQEFISGMPKAENHIHQDGPPLRKVHCILQNGMG